jgi:hypothetical protein
MSVVQWFWEALRSFSPEQRAQLLQWTTGHARVPVQGFSHLMGRDGVLRRFTLTSVELSQAVYPRAHTCFNRIDIPLYESKEDLIKGFEFVLELGDATFSMDYPRAHTCFNRIDVPLYRTKEELVASFEFVLELGDQTFTMD